MEILINLKNLQDQAKLVQAAVNVDGYVDCIKGRYCVDAKSQMGVICIGLGKCKINCNGSEASINTFMEEIKELIEE